MELPYIVSVMFVLIIVRHADSRKPSLLASRLSITAHGLYRHADSHKRCLLASRLSITAHGLYRHADSRKRCLLASRLSITAHGLYRHADSRKRCLLASRLSPYASSHKLSAFPASRSCCHLPPVCAWLNANAFIF